MAYNSNSRDAPWLPNFQTEMFSVYVGNAQSSCLVVGAGASYTYCLPKYSIFHWFETNSGLQ